MNLRCPQCDILYHVPDTDLTPGRPLRCGACGHAWHLDAPSAAAEQPSPAALDGTEPGHATAPANPVAPRATGSDAEESGVHGLAPAECPPAEPDTPHPGAPDLDAADLPRLTPPRPPAPPSRAPLLAAWALSVGILATLAGLAYSNGAGIAAAWPPAGRLLPGPHPVATAPAHAATRHHPG